MNIPVLSISSADCVDGVPLSLIHLSMSCLQRLMQFIVPLPQKHQAQASRTQISMDLQQRVPSKCMADKPWQQAGCSDALSSCLTQDNQALPSTAVPASTGDLLTIAQVDSKTSYVTSPMQNGPAQKTQASKLSESLKHMLVIMVQRSEP